MMMKFKKLIAILLCGVLVCSMTACKNTENTEIPTTNETEQTTPTQNKLPPTLKDLSETVGFSIEYPSAPKDSFETYAVENNSIEITFISDGVMTGRIIKAKADNTPNAEIFAYTETKTETRENIEYTIHYNEEDNYNLITWSTEEFSYLVYTSTTQTMDSIIALAQQVK